MNVMENPTGSLSSIQVASGFVPRLNRGVDFEVWYFIKLVAIGEAGSSFGIYRGNGPAYGASEIPMSSVKEVVLGRKTSWRLSTSAPGVFDINSHADVLIETGIRGGLTFMHIFASPFSESDWDTIREMVRSLRDESGTYRHISPPDSSGSGWSVREIVRSFRYGNGSNTFVLWSLCCVLLVVIVFAILLVIRKRRRITKPKATEL